MTDIVVNIAAVRRQMLAQIVLLEELAVDDALLAFMAKLRRACLSTLGSHGLGTGKILVCGNGGSAADALHFAAELTGRYQAERSGFAAVALCADPVALTTIANDFGFEKVFARQVEAIGNPGDVLLVLSTSGMSSNIWHAVDMARNRGLDAYALLGKSGGTLTKTFGNTDGWAYIVPSDVTSLIQDVHHLLLHALAEEIEGQIMANIGTIFEATS